MNKGGDGNKGFNTLRVFEAFAGYGSQSIALRNLGIDHEVVAISEIDKYAIKAYEAIHGPTLNLGDISKIKVEDIPNHDLFTYSYPCQSISVAGKQEGMIRAKTRSGLLYECERIIEAKRPKYLLLENVKNLVGKKFKPHFDEWLSYLESLGYTNYWQVLNAKNYGVPQNRERVFVVSILGDHDPYEFPKPIPLDRCIKDILEDEVDEKYYINKPFHLVNKGHQAELDIKGQDCIKRAYGTDKIAPTLTTMQGGMREPKIIIDDTQGFDGIRYYDKYSPTLRAGRNGLKTIEYLDTPHFIDKSKISILRDVANCITAREDRGISNRKGEGTAIIESVERTPLKFLNRNGKKTDGQYTFCVDTCHTGGIKEHYSDNSFRIRKLTPRECFRLMGMRVDDIDKIQEAGISNTQQYKMAGNSIVVDVLEAIFRELFLKGDK